MVYKWTENLTFGKTGTIRKYLVENLDLSAHGVSWMTDKNATIEIPIEATSTSVMLSLMAKPLIEDTINIQHIKININNRSISFDAYKNDFSEYFMYIDKGYIENRKTVRITISASEAISGPRINNSEGPRVQGLCLMSLKIDKLELAHSPNGKINRNFCAFPWMFITLEKNGLMYLCPRNPDPIENWFINDLDTGWNSSKMLSFRKAISHGYYPNKYCKSCHLDSGCDTSFNRLSMPISSNLSQIKRSVATVKNELFQNNFNIFSDLSKQLTGILHLKTHNNYSHNLIQEIYKYIERLHSLRDIIPYLNKITLLLDAFDAYLSSHCVVKVKPLFRSVTLTDKCNANCIHCLTKFKVPASIEEQLPKKYLQKAFGDSEYLNFFLAGTEFFMYKHWKEVIDYFKKSYVKFDLSTNGILLTRRNIKYIVDSDGINFINISLDGAKKETIEFIRRNVNFDKLVGSIRFLFSYLIKKNADLLISFSFVCMKQNIEEAPEFVSLCDRLRTCDNGIKYKNVMAFYAKLENYGDLEKKYSSFYEKSYVDIFDSKYNPTLHSIWNKSKALDIPVHVNNISIREVLQI